MVLIIIVCTLLAIGFILLLGAIILQTAVWITNGMLGGRELSELDYHRGEGAYREPIPRPKSRAGLRIPFPGVMYAILVNIMTGLAAMAAQFSVALGVGLLVGMAAPGPREVPAAAGGTAPATRDVTIHTKSGNKTIRYEEWAPGRWAEKPSAPARAVVLVENPWVFATSLLANVLVSVLVLKWALPTTFLRAAVVEFWSFVIWMILGFVVGFTAAAVFGVTIPDLPDYQSQWNNYWSK
ncbi:MAG TPA: hypothetical protein VH092_11430 [Urbifossiella sp.]|jgi:hypothetical protein|nr:hypothetical protein [Urbifossiella sp.]